MSETTTAVAELVAPKAAKAPKAPAKKPAAQPAKAAPKGKPAKDKATPAKSEKTAATKPAGVTVTGTQTAVLRCLIGGPKSRAEIKAVCNISKGLAKVVGAGTSETPDAGTLLGKGLVKCGKMEDGAMTFALTAAGRKVLTKGA